MTQRLSPQEICDRVVFLDGTFCSRKTGAPFYSRIDRHGYRLVRISRREYFYHRLIWLFATGDWPKFCIDHIDGNPSNNSISNLRDVSASQNSRNARRRIDNTSGITGVSWHKKDRRWVVKLSADGVRKTVGVFVEKQSAVEACLAARLEFGYGPNHGRATK